MTLRSELAAAAASAQAMTRRLNETQRRLEAAEAASVLLHEELNAVSSQLVQERLKREAADKAVQKLGARAEGLERQCQDLSATNRDSEARADKAEAEVAARQELEHLRQVPHDGKESAVGAAAQVARVERAIRAQTGELLTALAALRLEAEGFLTVGATAVAPSDSGETEEVVAVEAPAETEDECALPPYSIPRLTTWAQPEPTVERPAEAVAS